MPRSVRSRPCAAVSSLAALIVAGGWMESGSGRGFFGRLVTAGMLESAATLVILCFIIYFVVLDLLKESVKEAKHWQTIQALTKSIEARDTYTSGHSDRVATLGRMIAERMQTIDPQTVYTSGLIHDVGKLAVPDTILLKPARLTNAEFEIIRRHPAEGARISRSLGIAAGIRTDCRATASR